MRVVHVIALLLVVSCKIDRQQSDIASEGKGRVSFSYHLELKGRGLLGGLGGVSGHKMLGDLGCLTTTVSAKGEGYLIMGDSTRKAKSQRTDKSSVYIVQVNDTVTIDVDKNFRPLGNHNQFSLLRYFVHLAKTRSGQKGLTFGYDMDYGGIITAVDGHIKKVKNNGRNIRYEMKGQFIKADGKRRKFDLGHTAHGADGEIVSAEIVIPKEIIGEKTDVGVLLTPMNRCRVSGANGSEWNFDNPVHTGQG